jgi:hypothetical protein
MASLRQHAGYLIIDHRDSPGLTAADVAHVPNAVVVGKGETFEADVLTCSHCQRGVLLNPARERPRGYCGKCDHYICDSPGCQVECLPIRKLLDDLQNQAARGPLVLTDA